MLYIRLQIIMIIKVLYTDFLAVYSLYFYYVQRLVSVTDRHHVTGTLFEETDKTEVPRVYVNTFRP